MCLHNVRGCSNTEFLNIKGECEKCPDSYLANAIHFGRCLQLDRPKIMLIKDLEKAPIWSNYGEQSASTSKIKYYFEALDAAGGPLTQPIQPGTFKIKSPLITLTHRTPADRYLSIYRIQKGVDNPNILLDVWLAPSVYEDVEPLKKMTK